MTSEQTLLCAILVATVVLFAWGKWRHDVVAVATLLASVIAGLVPREAAFAGFGHPAAIAVACVLVLSRELQTSGAVDAWQFDMYSSAISNSGPSTRCRPLRSGLVTWFSLALPVATPMAAQAHYPPKVPLLSHAPSSLRIRTGADLLRSVPSSISDTTSRAPR